MDGIHFAGEHRKLGQAVASMSSADGITKAMQD
jgi:hypothetical protein